MTGLAATPHDAPTILELTVGPPAHGGHCVARHQGRVIFVRHALPGERVRARVTGTTNRYWRADAVQILRASPDRVPSIWPEAGPGGVGGGELAHVALPAQRRWKRDIIAETLRRIGHVEPGHPALEGLEVQHVPVPGGAELDAGSDTGSASGTGYRTRITLVADDEGRAGMFAHRSDEVMAVNSLPLAHPRIQALDLLQRRWPAGARIQAVAPAAGEPVVLVDGRRVRGRSRKDTDRPGRVREEVALPGRTYSYRVSADGFWQPHAGAPAVLVSQVLAGARLQRGDAVLEAYSGSGLLTSPLADAVGPNGRVDAVEGAPAAVADARRNAHGQDQIHLHEADVRTFFSAGPPASASDHGRADVVVLDPPRTGAGKKVMASITQAGPQRVVYVACDPAALARDTALARAGGYELVSLRALDLFPHTHHVECVATLVRA